MITREELLLLYQINHAELYTHYISLTQQVNRSNVCERQCDDNHQ